MGEIRPVVKEIYVVENRHKSIKKAFMGFAEYRLFGARIKVVRFSNESSSRVAELSIEIMKEEFKRELTEIYEF